MLLVLKKLTRMADGIFQSKIVVGSFLINGREKQGKFEVLPVISMHPLTILAFFSHLSLLKSIKKIENSVSKGCLAII